MDDDDRGGVHKNVTGITWRLIDNLLEHLAPFAQFLLQKRFGDHFSLILSDQRGREMAAHGVFHHFIVFAAAEQDADAGVFMRTLVVPVERFQIKGQLAHVLRFKTAGLQLEGDQWLRVAEIR